VPRSNRTKPSDPDGVNALRIADRSYAGLAETGEAGVAMGGANAGLTPDVGLHRSACRIAGRRATLV
jgi:hypothetical protein